jgi:arylsulfatase A-like enzyme
VFILADDLGWRDLGVYDSRLYETPAIDRLANQGIRFTQAYTAAHICSPTRASILTGKHPARINVTDWIPGWEKPNAKLQVPDWTQKLEQSHTTIGEHLQNAGYATAWFGKWHLGAWGAQNHGFDAGKQDWDLNKKKDPDDPKGVYTLTEQAIEFMDRQKNRPFFVTLSHYAPHTPVRANPEVVGQYKKRKRQLDDLRQTNARYAGMIHALDRSVGDLLTYLEDANLRDNTLVIFYSDNGALEKKSDNDPLRAGKATVYEGGIRVPLIIRWPGHVPADAVSHEMVSSVDLLPTFLELADAAEPDPKVDGVSLVDVITEGQTLSRDTLYWHYPHYHKMKPGGAIRQGRYKLIQFFEDGRLELYDLKSDLGERNNLTKEKPQLTRELLSELRAWRDEVNAQMPESNPEYDPEKAP